MSENVPLIHQNPGLSSQSCVGDINPASRLGGNEWALLMFQPLWLREGWAFIGAWNKQLVITRCLVSSAYLVGLQRVFLKFSGFLLNAIAWYSVETVEAC